MTTVKTDLAVVGLGSVGAMALWQASSYGKLDVVGVEQFRVGHPYGSYAGESRLFRLGYHEGESYVPLLRCSRDLWRRLEAESGSELLLNTGVLTIGRERDQSMANLLSGLTKNSLDYRRLGSEELREKYPQHDYDPSDIGVLDTGGGALRPERSVLTAVQLARSRGASVIDGTEVLAIDDQPGGVTIETTRGRIEALWAIVSAGSWSAKLNPAILAFTRLVPLALTWFMPYDIRAFVPERFPAFIRDRGDTHMFGAPTLDGYSIKACLDLGWESVAALYDVPTAIDAEQLSEIGSRVGSLLPGLNPEPVRASVHHDVFTTDRVPVVDVSGTGRVVTVAGLSGHGFKLAPALGQMTVHLALGHDSQLYSADFSIANHLLRVSKV